MCKKKPGGLQKDSAVTGLGPGREQWTDFYGKWERKEKDMRNALSRQEVIDAVERRGCKNPPAFLHKFWGMGLEEKYGERLS